MHGPIMYEVAKRLMEQRTAAGAPVAHGGSRPVRVAAGRGGLRRWIGSRLVSAGHWVGGMPAEGEPRLAG